MSGGKPSPLGVRATNRTPTNRDGDSSSPQKPPAAKPKGKSHRTSSKSSSTDITTSKTTSTTANKQSSNGGSKNKRKKTAPNAGYSSPTRTKKKDNKKSPTKKGTRTRRTNTNTNADEAPLPPRPNKNAIWLYDLVRNTENICGSNTTISDIAERIVAVIKSVPCDVIDVEDEGLLQTMLFGAIKDLGGRQKIDFLYKVLDKAQELKDDELLNTEEIRRAAIYFRNLAAPARTAPDAVTGIATSSIHQTAGSYAQVVTNGSPLRIRRDPNYQSLFALDTSTNPAAAATDEDPSLSLPPEIQNRTRRKKSSDDDAFVRYNQLKKKKSSMPTKDAVIKMFDDYLLGYAKKGHCTSIGEGGKAK